MMLAQIDTEKKQAVAKAEELFATAERENRSLTDEERATVAEHLAKANDLETKLKAGKVETSLREQLAGFRAATPAEVTALDQQAGRRVAARSWGQQVTASILGEAIKAGAFRSRYNSPGIELRAETLTSIADPAGGGALITPDYQQRILPILSEPATVRSLIASGTTASNQVVYFKESLATNAAAAVAETAAKPESALRFERVTDDVKKIATWIPVSTEMLEDFPQIQSYIDGRLRIFIREEVDDQILNGDGVDEDLLGIRNRVGLTSLYTLTGSDNVMDAIHKQMTLIMVNSYVMPDGIVMNPLDWEVAALTKASTAGLYFGAGPFSPMQTRTMWGLPVVITQRIPRGRALIGAFATMAQTFSKGGITVDMSNSHEDYFVKNKVAIRAEERLALAVYRPPAFGEVDLGTSESES
jgi:HK97 family phage major capsid protein